MIGKSAAVLFGYDGFRQIMDKALGPCAQRTLTSAIAIFQSFSTKLEDDSSTG